MKTQRHKRTSKRRWIARVKLGMAVRLSLMRKLGLDKRFHFVFLNEPPNDVVIATLYGADR